MNYDLLLRCNLHIVAEHDFKVEHTLLALPGTKKEDIKKVQALTQCDNYIRKMGFEREATYDTAGSAKLIKEGNLVGCAAIASDLAGSVHGLDAVERNIEDHDNNFTRFLVLSRNPVTSVIPPDMPAKTSIVFVLPNDPGALYKALACFSLRDIDFSKIESRPTSVCILELLQYEEGRKKAQESPTARDAATSPLFRYTFYLDFRACEYDDNAQNALLHLKELSDYVRVLGSFPRGSRLIGDVRNQVEGLEVLPLSAQAQRAAAWRRQPSRKKSSSRRLKIGIIGFGKFGQFLAKTFAQSHDVFCVDKDDMSAAAKDLGCEFFPLYDLNAFAKVVCMRV